jgi:hypothetical protein
VRNPSGASPTVKRVFAEPAAAILHSMVPVPPSIRLTAVTCSFMHRPIAARTWSEPGACITPR